MKIRLILCLMMGALAFSCSHPVKTTQEVMFYKDSTRVGVPFAKDPTVVHFKDRYLMYYSVPPRNWDKQEGWNIGIAESKDMIHWYKIGEMTPDPDAPYEAKGLCAPGSFLRAYESQSILRNPPTMQGQSAIDLLSIAFVLMVTACESKMTFTDVSATTEGRISSLYAPSVILTVLMPSKDLSYSSLKGSSLSGLCENLFPVALQQLLHGRIAFLHRDFGVRFRPGKKQVS